MFFHLHKVILTNTLILFYVHLCCLSLIPLGFKHLCLTFLSSPLSFFLSWFPLSKFVPFSVSVCFCLSCLPLVCLSLTTTISRFLRSECITTAFSFSISALFYLFTAECELLPILWVVFIATFSDTSHLPC